MRTSVGVLEVDDVQVANAETITTEDARRAGMTSRTELIDKLNSSGDGQIYRIELHYVGPDPRVALRERDRLSSDDVAELKRRLERLDAASRIGPWTTTTLKLIADNEAVRAVELAEQAGRDKPSFKRDVRKLKELGLTESLQKGYRLSPRGRALLKQLES
jgi:hypothetical protein